MISFTSSSRPVRIVILIAILISPPPSSAQSPQPPTPAPAPAPKPAPAPSAEPAPQPAKEPPAEDDLNLDDLLGTTKQSTGSAAAAADLNRKLSAKELGDAFHEAVVLMGDAAGRIKKSNDTGLTTQRVQETIVRKLDLLIEQMEQQSQSSQPKPDPNQQSDPSQANQRRQQQRQQSDQRNGENNAELEPPARRDGQLGPDIDAARAAWGSLPERVRQMLLQGSTDKFSETYKKLTQEYYRKLAEEGKK